jgi:hypothetical protein
MLNKVMDCEQSPEALRFGSKALFEFEILNSAKPDHRGPKFSPSSFASVMGMLPLQLRLKPTV